MSVIQNFWLLCCASACLKVSHVGVHSFNYHIHLSSPPMPSVPSSTSPSCPRTSAGARISVALERIAKRAGMQVAWAGLSQVSSPVRYVSYCIRAP